MKTSALVQVETLIMHNLYGMKYLILGVQLHIYEQEILCITNHQLAYSFVFILSRMHLLSLCIIVGP